MNSLYRGVRRGRIHTRTIRKKIFSRVPLQFDDHIMFDSLLNLEDIFARQRIVDYESTRWLFLWFWQFVDIVEQRKRYQES